MARTSKFDGMMQEVCVGMGFCGSHKEGKPLRVTQFIPAQGRVTAEEFAEWLLTAEAMNPAGTRAG